MTSRRLPPAPPFSGSRAILFDLDGVLVDSYEVWFRLLNHTSAAFGGLPIDRTTFGECWGQGVEADVKRFFPHKSVAEAEGHYHGHFMQFADALRIEPHAKRVVGALTSAGLRLALITNTPAPLAREILTYAGLAIETVVGGTDVAQGKPAPHMIHEACRRLGVAAAHAVVVGDSDYDAGAAGAASVPFIGFRRPGDATVDDLGALLPLLGLD